MLEFEWYEANIAHVARHIVLPHQAEEVIRNKPLDLGTHIEKGEVRVSQLGNTDAGRILVVVITWRGSKLRVVTSYPAMQRLRRLYADQKGGTHNEGF